MNMLPSAISILSAVLKGKGHTVDIFDTTDWIIEGEDFDSDKSKEENLTARPFDDSKLKETVKTSDVSIDFSNKLKEYNPDLLAFSVSEDLFPIAELLLTKSKDAIKAPVIMGGVFPTFAPEKCLALEKVDMICIGEGEDALSTLCSRMENGEDYSDIPGLWIKKESGIVKNNISAPVNFDNNPLPDYTLFNEPRLYRPMQGRVWRMLPVETNRGCPYQCTYCNSPVQRQMYKDKTGGRHFRRKSIETIERDLNFLKDDMKAEAIYFWADTFLACNDKEFEDFCNVYKRINLPFWCQTRPEEIQEDRIKKLIELGCFRMSLGVEHGNEDFRINFLKRNVTNKTIIENLKILNDCGLFYSVNNIMGFPTETRELAMDTVEINRHIGADSANAYAFSPFHGTPLRALAEENGYCDKDLIARSVTRPTLLNMPQFTPEQIEGLRRCFILYVKFPKNRWDEIKLAESFTPEGDEKLNELRKECAEKYMNFD
jgi:radical SAM superfamily enzyme YgiQ (UPF0313 family)